MSCDLLCIAFLITFLTLLLVAVSAMLSLAKQCAFEEPSVETITGENILTWPHVVSPLVLLWLLNFLDFSLQLSDAEIHAPPRYSYYYFSCLSCLKFSSEIGSKERLVNFIQCYLIRGFQ